MEFTHAVVATLDRKGGRFVRMFQCEAKAIEWACKFLRRNYAGITWLMDFENGPDMLHAFICQLGVTEWFFVQEVIFHHG